MERRNRVAGFLTAVCLAGLTAPFVVAPSSQAEPSLAEVSARADDLYHKAEQAAERYNDARLLVQKARARIDALQTDIDRQEDAVEEARRQVVTSVVSQYQSSALTTAAQAVLAEDPESFLDRVVTVSELTSRQGQVVAALQLELDRLEVRRQIVAREAARMERARAELRTQRDRVEELSAEADALVSRLEDERDQRASRNSDRIPAVPASGRAAAAINYAMAQVGDAYVWGAAGPDGFDCSGLTMAAWAQAGVSLPHSSRAQMSSGTPVSSSALQPGDLVFYYQPVSHVGMYIGNGQIVHAANPRTDVQVTGVFSMPFTGAVRPG